MINIAICDDSMIQQQIVKELIEEYLSGKEVEASVVAYSKPTDLFEAVKDGATYDVFFLDMIMEEMKGIELGFKLRDAGVDGKIIFLTVTSAFEAESEFISNSEYIIKPLDVSKLDAVLNKVISVD